MRRLSLGTQMFMAIVAVALGTVLTVGLFARGALSRAFDAYLAALPLNMMGRPRVGGRMLGAAEQTFVNSVDRGVLMGAVIAVALAAVIAIMLAAYLSRPLRRLESATERIIGGDLSQRVDVAGPEEVASLGASFNRMADSLERAEALRSRMVADVAHELRNPLAAARAQAEGMADGILTVDAARLESLTDDLKHLSALIDDLQELAIAEAGRMRYEMSDLDLVAVVRREAERAGALLSPGVDLAVSVPAEALLVHGDERRLGQVLRNLLSNAARHTRAGGVTVKVELAHSGRAVVRVIDTGEGIAPGELDHIFERFYRADAARASDTGGAGLGLAISRAIIMDHGGDVFAHSRLGEGTEIGFELPVR